MSSTGWSRKASARCRRSVSPSRRCTTRRARRRSTVRGDVGNVHLEPAVKEGLRERLKRWQSDPIAFARECLLFGPDAWQAQVLGAAVDHPRLALKACKGPGKSAILAVLVWWFLTTR